MLGHVFLILCIGHFEWCNFTYGRYSYACGYRPTLLTHLGL